MSLLKTIYYLVRALLMSRTRLEAENRALRKELDELQQSLHEP
jgi:cell shape-determining protein MreC